MVGKLTEIGTHVTVGDHALVTKAKLKLSDSLKAGAGLVRVALLSCLPSSPPHHFSLPAVIMGPFRALLASPSLHVGRLQGHT